MPLMSVRALKDQVDIAWAFAAAPAHVWDGLTSHRGLHHWLGELVQGEISPDSTFTIDHGDGYLCRSAVEVFEPGTALAYSWKFEDEPYSRVAWSIAPESTGSILTLSHTGLVDPAGSYRDGWLAHLLYLEAHLLGTPMPMSMLWTVYATIERGRTAE